MFKFLNFSSESFEMSLFTRAIQLSHLLVLSSLENGISSHRTGALRSLMVAIHRHEDRDDGGDSCVYCPQRLVVLNIAVCASTASFAWVTAVLTALTCSRSKKVQVGNSFFSCKCS